MDDVSVLSLLGRLIVSLAVVLGLMALVARLVRKGALPGLKRSKFAPGALQVVARQPLSRTASVVLVRAADRALVIGVTDAGITLLAELDPASLDVDESAGAAGAVPVAPAVWQGFIDAVRERSVRRA